MCLLSNLNDDKPCRELGFSLIEIICVLVLLGMIGTVFLRGYVNSVKTHVDADENYQQVQKNQAGLLRIILEMQNSTGLSVASNVLTYTYNGATRTISKSGSNLVLHKNSDNSDHILIDNVSNFIASFSVKKLSFSVTTSFSDSTTKTFATSVYVPG